MLALRNSKRRAQLSLEAMLIAATLLVLVGFIYFNGYHNQGEAVVFSTISEALTSATTYLDSQTNVQIQESAYSSLNTLKELYPSVQVQVIRYQIVQVDKGYYRVYVTLQVNNTPTDSVVTAISEFLVSYMKQSGYVVSSAPLIVKTQHWQVEIIFNT